MFSSFSRSSRTPRSHEKHDRFGQELLEVINIYLNDCKLLFSYGKNNPFLRNWPPTTWRALVTAVMRGASVIIKIILVAL